MSANLQAGLRSGNRPREQPLLSTSPLTHFRPENIMSDDKSKTGSPDRDRINVHEKYEVEYWTKKLGVSADQLKSAVSAAGPTAKAVEAHLKGTSRK
jgi:hypothetical protein